MQVEKETAKPLIGLLRSAICEYKMSIPSDSAAFDFVYRLAKFHSVEATAYYGVIKNHIILPESIADIWSKRKNLNSAKTIVELYERDAIYKLFSDNGIHFLPLKGLLIKDMYPSPEYRQMADLDILVFSEQMEQAGKLLIDSGYQCEHTGEGHHDAFSKPPYVTVELHHEMVGKSQPVYNDYYKDVWTKAQLVEGTKYRLSWNDFYIFMLVHFAKHYYGGGSGIRSIMDIYVFLEKHRDDLDEEYLKTEFEKLKLIDFRKEAETLAASWFGSDEPDLDSDMAEYVLTSGVYGTRQHILEKRIAGSSTDGKVNRVVYVWKRLFPDRHFMSYYYPKLEKKPYLLPWCWLKRIFKKWKKGVGELKYVNSKK